MLPLKAEVIRTGHYRVNALPFGGPLKGGKDLDRQYFSPRTDPKPHWFNQRPVIWHHGLDKTMPEDPLVGHEEPIMKARDGWWAEIWLDKQNKYFAEIDDMIAKDRLYGSSGTFPHMIKAASDGELLQWPHVEQTLSPIPRNPYSVVRAIKALENFTEAGIDVSPELADIFSALEDLSTDLRQTSERGDVAAKANEQLKASLDTLEDFVRRLGG